MTSQLIDLQDVRNRGAFTLVELAIVLVIIALLIGTVTEGQSMLKSQRLRRVPLDAGIYMAAFQQFKAKYDAVPGDFAGATRVWGRADGGTPTTDNCAAPSYQWSSPQATCNGDGNGFIGQDNRAQEAYRAWSQLALGGFIQGSFSGVKAKMPVGGGYWYFSYQPGVGGELGQDVPASQIDNSGYAWYGNNDSSIVDNATTPSTINYDGIYANSLVFGGRIINGMTLDGPAITAADALAVDSKTDDGKPNTGNILAFKPTAPDQPNCVNAIGATYNTSNLEVTCALIFLNAMQNKAPE